MNTTKEQSMATHRLTALSLAILAVATPMVGSIAVAPSAFAANRDDRHRRAQRAP